MFCQANDEKPYVLAIFNGKDELVSNVSILNSGLPDNCLGYEMKFTLKEKDGLEKSDNPNFGLEIKCKLGKIKIHCFFFKKIYKIKTIYAAFMAVCQRHRGQFFNDLKNRKKRCEFFFKIKLELLQNVQRSGFFYLKY